MTSPAFIGQIEFTLSIRALDESVLRTAKIDYAYTPTWPHYHVPSRTERVGEPHLGLRLSVTLPRPGRPRAAKGTNKEPHWLPLDQLLQTGVLRKKLHERLHASIDFDALHTDRVSRSVCLVQ
jgi:hypothetical protein